MIVRTLPDKANPDSPCPICNRSRGRRCFTDRDRRAFCETFATSAPPDLEDWHRTGVYGDGKFGIFEKRLASGQCRPAGRPPLADVIEDLHTQPLGQGLGQVDRHTMPGPAAFAPAAGRPEEVGPLELRIGPDGRKRFVAPPRPGPQVSRPADHVSDFDSPKAWSECTWTTNLPKGEKCGTGGQFLDHKVRWAQIFLTFHCHKPGCEHCAELKRRWHWATANVHWRGLDVVYTALISKQERDGLSKKCERAEAEYLWIPQPDEMYRAFSDAPLPGFAERTREEALDLFLTALYARPNVGGRSTGSSDGWELVDTRTHDWNVLKWANEFTRDRTLFLWYAEKAGIGKWDTKGATYTVALRWFFNLNPLQLHVFRLRLETKMEGPVDVSKEEFDQLQEYARPTTGKSYDELEQLVGQERLHMLEAA